MNTPDPQVPESQFTRTIRYELQVRRVQVSAIKQITPRIRRIQVQGPELEGFITSAFADHVKIFFPDDQGEVVTPTIEAGGISRSKRKVSPRRDYTPINYDPQELSLEFDFALHEGTGIANHWAGQAQVGQTLALAGPRGSKLLPRGFNYYVFGGDESAYPALSEAMNLMRELAKPAKFLIETLNESEQSYFADQVDRDDLDISFYSQKTPFTAVLAGLKEHAQTIDAAQTYFWFAGEARGLQPIRRYLRQDLMLDRRQVAVDGYWKLGKADHDHHEPVDPKDPS